MNIDWFVWRPIIEKVTTLEEVERHYSLCDLLDAHEALDIKMEMQDFYSKQAKAGK